MTLSELIQEAVALPRVPQSSISAYQASISEITEQVNECLTKNESIRDLIGQNPLQVMYDNHRNHAALMTTIFALGLNDLLAKTIPWVYRAYSAHHFSADYFPLAIKTWMEAIGRNCPQEKIGEIIAIYQWMLDRHEHFLNVSKTEKDLPPAINKELLEKKNLFLNALLAGSPQECLMTAQKLRSSGIDMESLYLHIIQPAMYEIGMLWERGIISVAQEHLASAIVGRILASSNIESAYYGQKKAKAVITSAPNEFHEIGAWMISDLLEIDGWTVRYLGANTPQKDLIDLLHSFKPDILALSVTMPFNILNTKEIISAIKRDEALKKTVIIVGGRAFNEHSALWQKIGADYFAANILDLKTIARNLLQTWTHSDN